MRIRALMLCSSVALAALSSTAHAQLSAPETNIVATIDAEYERSVALLERLVNQNSGTMNFAGVKTVGDMMRAELEPLGFRVEWIDMAKAGRAGHLIASKPGKKGAKKLLLIAHLDTVFEADSPFQTFVRNGDEAMGPGAGDDKGGLVTMTKLLALELGPHGVRVNSVSPGFVDGGMSTAVFANPRTRDIRTKAVPLRRLGSTEDIAQAVMFLASDAAAYVHGQDLGVDGGLVHSLLSQIPRD